MSGLLFDILETWGDIQNVNYTFFVLNANLLEYILFVNYSVFVVSNDDGRGTSDQWV